VFTAGTVAHATRAMERLGVTHLFDDIFDIVHADYVPKPQRAPYDGFLRAHNVDPKRSAFFEDIARNLEVPHDMGMVTVLVTSDDNRDANHLNKGADAAHVHHVTEHLAGFLSDVNKSGRAL
jgi:putative hydrolase of the HAD superfamily